jgi:hypothetical protein
MRYGNIAQCRVTCETINNPKNFEIHHVVDDDLKRGVISVAANFFLVERTVKSVGSEVSQLRVHPTVGLNLAARSAANALTAVRAV